VTCTYAEIEAVIQTLSPCGLFLSVSEVPGREAGLSMLHRLEQWTAAYHRS
jgi:hypothetical protein